MQHKRNPLMRIGYRFLGEPPASGATRMERLLWLRGFYLRMIPLSVAVSAMVALFLPAPWAWVVPCLSVLLWAQGFVTLNVQIRRERRREGA